jgi:ParB-like chromosome segregation protein Spo0J
MHRELAPRKCPEFHSLAEIFPVLGEQHLEALAKDVAARGLLDEIVLCDGKILDGRCRYLACERAGVAPKFRNTSATIRSGLSSAKMCIDGI